MAQPKKTSKIPVFFLVAIVGAAAGFGYFKQSTDLKETVNKSETEAAAEANKAAAELLTMKPNDIILGDANALVTIVEYSSLSCSHCATFHQEILPTLQKEFIAPGKVKLVLRHFPLNEPAMKAAALVECSGKQGLQRSNFMKVLFETQAKWAFDSDFLKNLKQIASVGGIDSAVFDSCIADKDLETHLLVARQEAQEKLGISATPYFFINGKKYDGDRTVDGFKAAIANSAATNRFPADAPQATVSPAPTERDNQSKPTEKAKDSPLSDAEAETPADESTD